MSKKVLIVYGTRYGATEGTSEEIAKVLQGTGLEVRVADAKREKIKDFLERKGYYNRLIEVKTDHSGSEPVFLDQVLEEFAEELLAK